ncbi:cobalamin-binding protein [uncultured Aquitalea sp.]|uniref:cobalamin-binding protein n=1 Tax=uncultured Aquitalea sp. TaxID=540272 RepID=UPI0025EBC04E|nr:cobalamin-binding protein [uncultured Aquitalea sp.]
MTRCFLMLCLLTGFAGPARAAVSVKDAAGQTVALAQPARRIVSLAPHTTEMLYAVGAGKQLVGTVDYSNTPPAAKSLPRVGGYSGVSLEAILRLKPDLVVAWQDGGNPRELARLRDMGVAVYISHPLRLEDVASEMRQLGELAGSSRAKSAADAYLGRLAGLRQRYAARPPVSVFYQVSSAPIFTVSDKSFMGPMITLCGGRNVFAALPLPAPQVSMEAVVAAQPQVMLVSHRDMLAMWDRWNVIPAVAKGARYALDADVVSIPGPRLVDGAATVCRTLDTARRQLGLTLD